jgi:pimeloyl-ACP methyl ester carboxylesterase
MSTSEPDTIVLVHGLWLTPRVWEHWISAFERRDYRVLAPAYPGLEGEVEALRDDPSPIAALTVQDTVEHLAKVVGEVESPPVLIGHGFGGILVQLLLDRGLGAAGIAINSAPTEGVHGKPASQIHSAFPVLRNPANRHRAVSFTPEQWHYAFANTMEEAESTAAYERYHVPAPGSWVWHTMLANVEPGHRETWVDYRNDERAPLLFLAGGKDHFTPSEVNKANADRYEKSEAHTDYTELSSRDHFSIGAPGWESVLREARNWVRDHGPWIKKSLERRAAAAAG